MAEERIAADLGAELTRRWGRPVRIAGLAPIETGHSGFTYWVDTAEGERYVLRLSPPGARPAGPADVARQGRLMAALNAHGLPVPAIPAVSPEPVIDGRPFVLMERIAGARIEEVAAREDPHAIAAGAIEALQRLQAVPVAASGIGDEPPTPLAGELARWSWLMERAVPDLTGRAPELAAALGAAIPAERQPVLVHADFHLGNMLFEGTRVAALLDWEIAEIGQPLIDLGCLCVMVARRRFGEGTAPGGTIDLPLEAFVELYGADRQEFDWYLAFSLFKYAAILGYNLNLHRKGRRPDPMYEQESMYLTISGMIDDGIALLADAGR